MSAIVIQTHSHPTETTRLLSQSQPQSHSPETNSSTPSTSTFTLNPNSTSTKSKILDRVQPLKETISTSRFIIILIGVWSANFVFAFQSTAIPTLAPGISSGFEHAELSSYLGSFFALGSSAVIPVFGVLMETLGRTFAMDTACFFFGLGTILCALSTNIWMLIGARAVAGLGGGGLLTVASVIVTDLVPLRDRGFYQGIMMTVFGSGSMVGGPLSGHLADKYGWKISFWIQLPVIAFCAIVTTIFLPPSAIPPTHPNLISGLLSLDWLGTLLLIGSTTSLILGFSFHTSFLKPWSAPTVWGNLLGAAVGLAVFIWWEDRVERPVVPLGLLRSRHRGAIMASGFFLSVGNQAFMFQIPVYFAVIVNTSTARAGLILSVCGGLGLAIGSMVAGQHIRRGGHYRTVGLLALLPAIASCFVAATWTPAWPWWGYILTFFPASLCYSVFLCVQLIALISAVDSKSMPKATALLYTVRTLGVALGVSVGGSIQIGSLTSNLKSRLADVPNRDSIINNVLHNKAAIRLLPSPLQERALQAYASSLSTVWVVTGLLAIVTVICAMGIQEKVVGEGGVREGDVKGSGGGVVDGLGDGLGVGSVEGETRRV